MKQMGIGGILAEEWHGKEVGGALALVLKYFILNIAI